MYLYKHLSVFYCCIATFSKTRRNVYLVFMCVCCCIYQRLVDILVGEIDKTNIF